VWIDANVLLRVLPNLGFYVCIRIGGRQVNGWNDLL
jgi:hypothetical protein